tara:strand:- start:1427 stop:2530 length:1104 start_codon:yes stop_codon:yes gene_type:complete
MSFVRNNAVTGFTFGLVNKSTGAALTGVASAIGKYITKDGGTQASIAGSVAEEGNGQYSIDLSKTEMNASVVGLLFTHTDAIPVQFTIKTLGSPADTSTESTLSLSYADIRKELGWFMFGERTSSNWSSDEGAQIDDIVKSGLRNFYHPPPTNNSPRGYKWSFLEPTTTLSTVAGTSDYTLSADFGGLVGPMTYSTDDSRWFPIEMTGEHRIRVLRQRDYATLKSDPRLAAIRPINSDGSNGQRFQIMLYPTPDKAYTLSYRYHALPGKIDSTYPYPKGGEAHAETILESCLAVAEARMDNNAGIHAAAFQNRLNASISYDKMMHTPDYQGYNGDGSQGSNYSEQTNRYMNGDILKYNGSYFTDVNP